MDRRKAGVLAWQIAIVLLILATWQWGFLLRKVGELRPFVPGVLDPYFVSKPSEIWSSFLHLSCVMHDDGTLIRPGSGQFQTCLGDDPNNLWFATGVTLLNTLWGFLAGTSSGVVVGLVMGRSDYLSRVFSPFIVAANSVPRIALVPLIILMFGLGAPSKIVTAMIVVFFVVFFNTFEGARAVDKDQIAAARLLGANQWSVLRTVVVPSALSWVFASLTPAVSFALVGVIVAEFIGAERGIGKLIIEAQARASAADMMVAILVLMVVGVVLSSVVYRVQAHLLRWQPQFTQRGM